MTPGERMSSTNWSRSPICSRIRWGSSSQPSHFSSPEPVQTVGSRAQIRSTRCSVATATTSGGRELAALGANAVEQLGERVDELLDAFLLQHTNDVVVVDARFGELVEEEPRRVEAFLKRQRDLTVVLEGADRLVGHRVDSLGADQVVDVEHVAVGRVLRRRRGPEAPLPPGACGGESGPALAGENLLVALVGKLGVRDREFALQLVVAADLVKPLVGLRIDARDEE